MNGTTLYECMECGKVFRRKLHVGGAGSSSHVGGTAFRQHKKPGDIHCTVCNSGHVEVYSPPTPKEMKRAFAKATKEMII